MTIEVSLKAAACFTLQRHHLVKRAPRDRLLDVVDDVLGVNAQGVLNAYINLWNRVRGLTPIRLGEMLYVERTLVKSWLMRNTVHIVSTRRLPLYRRALLSPLLKAWDRWTMRAGAKKRADEWEPLYSRLLEILEDEPLSVREMLRILGWESEEKRRLLNRVVREMSLKGLICHADTEGPWYHAAEYRFARIDRWIGEATFSLSEEEARRELARRYLKAYGPASIGDLAYWSGMRVGEVRKTLQGLSDLVEVKVEERRMLILKEDLGELLHASEGEGATRLLPAFDILIMGHRDKRRLINPRHKPRIFLPRGDVAATLLVDDRIEGTWTLRKGRGNHWTSTLSTFRPLLEEEGDEVETQVEGLREFTGFDIEVKWRCNQHRPARRSDQGE